MAGHLRLGLFTRIKRMENRDFKDFKFKNAKKKLWKTRVFLETSVSLEIFRFFLTLILNESKYNLNNSKILIEKPQKYTEFAFKPIKIGIL
jgi:hypothetical protein